MYSTTTSVRESTLDAMADLIETAAHHEVIPIRAEKIRPEAIADAGLCHAACGIKTMYLMVAPKEAPHRARVVTCQVFDRWDAEMTLAWLGFDPVTHTPSEA